MSRRNNSETRAGLPGRVVGALDVVNAVAGKAAFVALWLLAAVVLLDIGMRAFATPTLWGAEVSVYLMLAVAFLGVGHATTEDAHFRVSVFVDLMGARTRRAVDLLCTALALAFGVGFTVGAVRLLAFYHELGFQTNTLLRVPMALLHALVAFGGLFLVLALAADLLRLAFGLGRASSAASDLPPA